MPAPSVHSALLESPSVLHDDYAWDHAQPLRFYPDMLGQQKGVAALLGLATLVLLVLAALGVVPLLALVAAPLLAFGTYHFAKRGFDKRPLLTVYPAKGLVARDCHSGIGWSLLDDVRLREQALGRADIELQFRPGMPWPGVRGEAEPEDDPRRGRLLLLDVSHMSPPQQKLMYQSIIKHYLAYRIKRGWGVTPSML